jgi:UrcA family protein
MRILTRIFALVSATSILMTATCAGAHADTAPDADATEVTGRTAVHYGDINLSDEHDAWIMLQRIERAAKTACGGHATVSSNTGTVDYHTFDECRARAVQRTVQRLGAPLVTRVYSEQASRLARAD